MAITQIFATPPIPPSSTDKTNFRTRYDAFLAYIQALGTGLSAFITQANALETNVNAKEVTCTSAALSSSASANFQGTWVNQTTVLGQSWNFNGIIYRVLIAGNASPITTPANWLPITYKECILATPVASAATTTIGTAASGDTVHITGTTTITSFGVSTTGTLRIVVFDGALTLTHNAISLSLPTGANIITAAGDTAEFVCENGASGYWRCTGYQRKDGTALYPYAPLNNANLTGIPLAPTAPLDTNTTQIATTAFTKTKSESVAIGIGQTWQNMTASRVSGTTYTNSTGKPIFILAYVYSGSNQAMSGFIDGIQVTYSLTNGTVASLAITTTLLVPNGSTYSITGGITKWMELRQ